MEIDNELPENWEIKKLGEISEIVNGSTPKTNEPRYWGGNILWLTPKDLSGFQGIEIFDTAKKITKEGYDSCSTKLLPKGTVLMSSRAPIGYLAIAGKEMCTNQGFKSFICSSKINNRYLFYYLKSVIPQLELEGSGTTFNEISKSKAENIPIPLPSVNVQQKIVAKLDRVYVELSNLRKELERKDRALELLPNVVLKKAFRGELVP